MWPLMVEDGHDALDAKLRAEGADALGHGCRLLPRRAQHDRTLVRPQLGDLFLGEQARDLVVIRDHETKPLR